MKIIVGGTFDAVGGSSSWLVQQLANSLGDDWLCINGGYVDFIHTFDPSGVDVLIWMPNVSNDEVKVVNTLTERNPSLRLIQSKRVIEKEYAVWEVIQRLQASHSEFGIMIAKPDGKFSFNLISADGSVNLVTDDICVIGAAIAYLV